MIQEPFKSKDLYLSAFLRAAGARMIDTERRGTIVIFVFEQNGDGMIHRLQTDYYNKSAKIDARTFVDEIKVLKTLCHM